MRGELAVLVLAFAAAGCSEAQVAPGSATDGPHPGMVRIPGGSYRLGPGEGLAAPEPAVLVRVPPFWIDAHEVTNADFARFVDATGYVTESERIGNTPVFEFTEPGAWRLVDGADWRHPSGPDSSLEGRLDHPVVNVSYNDALAYARWVGKRLPTDAEWEVAARGGLADMPFPWGTELEPDGRFLANYWQGEFPTADLAHDAWRGTAPVGRYAPNGYGLHDVAGNVWEWTSGASRDTRGRETRATRGGSFLCRERAAPDSHPCRGYRVVSRQFKLPEDANSNVGFRCAADGSIPNQVHVGTPAGRTEPE